MNVRLYEPSDAARWDEYVVGHPQATPWHLIGWKSVFETVYGLDAYYFLAEEGEKIHAVLPLFHIKSFLFGNSLTSMPFLDGGGVLADCVETETKLLLQASQCGIELGASVLELRMADHPPRCWSQQDSVRGGGSTSADQGMNRPWSVTLDKVRMVLPLPQDPEVLQRSFKSKLRSQIKKPIKERCRAVTGGPELIDDFYKVFSVNMRDLGSPVHSKRLFMAIMRTFWKSGRISVVYKDGAPLAAGLLLGFADTAFNPWASSLKRYASLSPNMLLYWSMLQYACEQGYSWFDFGRSSINEGTFQFKAQWGCLPRQLAWCYRPLNNKRDRRASEQKTRFNPMIYCWKRLPVPLTQVIGPMVRKSISL